MIIGNGYKLAAAFSRLSVYGASETRNVSTAGAPLCFQMTNALFAEPLKKKKKMDPMIAKMREERRKRKLEKQIRRLQKVAQTLKPIEEVNQVEELAKTLPIRQRTVQPITAEEAERRILLEKEWNSYKLECYRRDSLFVKSIIDSQMMALAELKQESEDLYQKAIDVDTGLLPYRTHGPVNTPPIENYNYPDGEYADISVVYEE